jgi:hypothetical protein
LGASGQDNEGVGTLSLGRGPGSGWDFFNQCPFDPDHKHKNADPFSADLPEVQSDFTFIFFNRDHDRGENFLIRVWLIRISFSIRVTIRIEKFPSDIQ